MSQSELGSPCAAAVATDENTTTTTPPTSFVFFRKLPQEIQVAVWTLVFDADTPRAQEVYLTASPMGPNGQTIKWGLRKIAHPDSPDSGDGITRKLMATSFLSLHVAKRVWGKWEPILPFSLEDKTHVKHPFRIPRHESRASKRALVDAASDLMILRTLPTVMDYPGQSEIPLPHKLVAHSWRPSRKGLRGELASRLRTLFPIFPELRVLYILIEDFEAEKAKDQVSGDEWRTSRFGASHE